MSVIRTTTLQPTNLVFDTGQTNSYKFCLFASGECDPKPNTAQQRDLGDGSLGFPKITDLAFLKVLKERYHFSEWEGREKFDDSLNPLLLNCTHWDYDIAEAGATADDLFKNFATYDDVIQASGLVTGIRRDHRF